MKRHIIVDGDIYLHRATQAAEFEVQWEGDLWTMSSNLRYAKQVIIENIKRLEYDLEPDKTFICLSGPHNFRKEIFPDYKGSRKDKRKPMGFQQVKEWMLERFDCVQKPQLEADDCLGILATKPGKIEKIMVSADKDLKTIPGKLYDMDGVITERSKAEADYYHLLQTLSGDATDGYPGCPKFGEKSAKKLLDKDPSWDAVLAAFKKQGKTEEEALTQARVAKILRHDDWDNDNQEVIPWTP
jgi:DNA polymerase-1